MLVFYFAIYNKKSQERERLRKQIRDRLQPIKITDKDKLYMRAT